MTLKQVEAFCESTTTDLELIIRDDMLPDSVRVCARMTRSELQNLHLHVLKLLVAATESGNSTSSNR